MIKWRRRLAAFLPPSNGSRIMVKPLRPAITRRIGILRTKPNKPLVTSITSPVVGIFIARQEARGGLEPRWAP